MVRDDERGQVMLAGAVLIAITLITVVVLLNGAVLAGGADGGTGDATEEAQKHRATVEADMTELANHSGGLNETNVNAYSAQYARLHAAGTPASIVVSRVSDTKVRFVYESPELSYNTEIEVEVDSP